MRRTILLAMMLAAAPSAFAVLNGYIEVVAGLQSHYLATSRSTGADAAADPAAAASRF
jgi:hypothetical protein